MIKRFLLLVLLFCVLTAPLARAGGKALVCAIDPHWPPLEFLDDDGNPTGYTVDFMDAVGRALGITVEYRQVAWRDMLTGLEEGKFDAICSSASVTPERKKDVDFSRPYYFLKQRLVVQSGTRITAMSDKSGMRVGVLKGSTGAAVAKSLPGLSVHQYDEIGTAMENLFVGGLDGVLVDEPVALYFAKIRYQGKLKVTGYPPGSKREHYAVAVKKGNRELLQTLNQGIAAVKARGLDRELRMKWVTR